MSSNWIPDGYHRLTPYLTVRGADQAIAFYRDAFGAEEHTRLEMPDGTVGHAEIAIGDAMVMLSDEMEEWGNLSPESLGGSPSSLMLYVDDVDAHFEQALQAGAIEKMPVQDQFYGDRSGTLTDPFGHVWTLGTHQEDLSEAELQDRWMDMLKGQKA